MSTHKGTEGQDRKHYSDEQDRKAYTASTPTPVQPCELCNAKTGFHAPGRVIQDKPCGCEVLGVGLLPNPWHIHFCPLHAQAPAMLEMLEDGVRAVELEVVLQNIHGESVAASLGLFAEKARALLAQIEKG